MMPVADMDAGDECFPVPGDVDYFPLTPAEFRLFFHLARRVAFKDGSTAIADMAEHCRLSEKVVQAALLRLEELGLIRPTENSYIIEGGGS